MSPPARKKQMTESASCLTCASLTGNQPLSPAPIIWEGTYWQLEHAHPTAVKGWLVLVFKRHVEALHDLTSDEFLEATVIIRRACVVMRSELKSQKEYVVCFAEKPGFEHVHFHIIARSPNLPEEHRGTRIFSLLGVDERNALTDKEILELCTRLKKRLKKSPTQ